MNKYEYIDKYYNLYAYGEVDAEMEATGGFLIDQAKGRVLDCGCGPVPQLWTIFMPAMTELYAIDLPQESIDFVNKKISTIHEWAGDFEGYKSFVESRVGALPEDYISTQVSKIKSVSQADMVKALPFDDWFFDTVISLYSLECLKNEKELRDTIANIKRILKPGGTLLHINTNGENKNNVLPAYTWNGLNQSSTLLRELLEEQKFLITCEEVKLPQNDDSMYKYSKIYLMRAFKQ
jgi:SAM-dependent methyltransferase